MLARTLAEIMSDIRHRLEEIERRMEFREWTGKITDVNVKDGLARVELDTEDKSGEPFKSPWIPWKEPAMGKIRFHTPPTKGEQVKLVSQSGDLSDAQIDYSLPSDTFKRPHDKEGELKIQIGETYLLVTDKKITIEADAIEQKANRIDHNKRGGGGGQSGVPVA